MCMSIYLKVKTSQKKHGIASYLITNNTALFHWLEKNTLPKNEFYIKNRHKYSLTKQHLIELKLKLYQLTHDNKHEFFPDAPDFQTPKTADFWESIDNLKKTINEILKLHDNKTDIKYFCMW